MADHTCGTPGDCRIAELAAIRRIKGALAFIGSSLDRLQATGYGPFPFETYSADLLRLNTVLDILVGELGAGPTCFEGGRLLMVTERQLSLVIERCVDAMSQFHERDDSRWSDDRMAAEVQVAAGFVKELGFSPIGIEMRIIRPVESELISLYGREAGAQLSVLFAKAFEDEEAR